MVDELDFSPRTEESETILKRFLHFIHRKFDFRLSHNPFTVKSFHISAKNLKPAAIASVILFGLVISLTGPSLFIKASPGVHLNVPQSPLSPGQPVYIEFWTDPGEDGTIQIDITKPPLLAIFWQSGPISINGGLLYDVTAPGFNDPGTYTVSASVSLAGGGGTIHGSTTFEVVGGGGQQPGQPGAGFDFHLEVSPPLREVEPGDTAHFQIQVVYSDPSYSGTLIQLQVHGLGHGMQWHSSPTGEVIISTSPETPPGDYQIEIVGEAQGIERHTVATLIVLEHPHDEPPPEEHPPEEEPEEHPPEEEPEEYPEEQPPEEEPEEHPPEEQPPEEYRPQEPQWEQREPPAEPGGMNIFSDPMYLIVIALVIIIILLIVALMRKS